MRSTITFNGKSSADFGLIVEYYPESVHAPRRGELITIPGRNGVIIREDGAYDTYSQTFQIWFRNTMNRDTFRIARDVAEWLLGASGFCRLEDTYEPEYFRLARFSGPLNVETVLKNHGRATLEFDVQPQRYLKSGETPIRYEGVSGLPFGILNPTQFESRPLLKFVDTTEVPPIVQQTLSTVENTYIAADGSVVNVTWGSGLLQHNVSIVPVSVADFDYAYVSCRRYAFYDANGDAIVVSDLAGYSAKKVVVPRWAATINIYTEDGYPSLALSFQAARPNPGEAAATINDVTISLDFSAHDTIYLDCDLHDAFYADGSNANAAVSFSSRVTDYPTFPGLPPGVSTIIPGDGSNLDFELTPRWWTL